MTLLALGSIAMGAGFEKIADMSDLLDSGTQGTGVTNTSSLYEEGNTVLSFASNNDAWLGINNNSLVSTIQGGEGYLLVTAWLRPEAGGENSVFSYGAQDTGIKFGLKTQGPQITTKSKADMNTGANSITCGSGAEWQFVAWSIKLDSNPTSANNVGRTFDGEDGKAYYSISNKTEFVTPQQADQTFAIGSGNSGSIRDRYLGDIANLTIYLSDTLPNTNLIASLNESAPKLKTVPEPATATLSLLALAGLAARRRR